MAGGDSSVRTPLLWLRTYDLANLRGDATAGLIVAAMLVPQAMAYATLAGLPPEAGLYASTLPLLAYALFGTSRQLAVGPVAMVSLLIAAAVSEHAEAGGADYRALATLVTLLVGALSLGLGLLRAGFLSNFVSHAVASGFTSAAAIVIGLSQMPHLMGVRFGGGHSGIALAAETVRKAGEAHELTLAMGLSAAAALWILKRNWPRFPAALLVTGAATLLVYALRLDQAGVRTVGDVPRGMAGLAFPPIDGGAIVALFPAAVVILFVGFMEGMAVAQWIAAREKYRVDANRELIGLGLANLVSGLFSGYCVAGGFSRTAVNYQAGARTPLATVVTAALVLATLWLLTPLFFYLPYAVLAAIVLAAVTGLIDGKEPIRLFRVKPVDAWTLVVTFFITLTVGISQGILVGVLFSLALFVGRSSRPRTAVLGYVESDNAFHDIAQYPDAKTWPHLVIIRVDASLYFANARFVEDRVREHLALQPAAKWVVMDMSGVNDIDAVAAVTLQDLMDELSPHGLCFAFAGMKLQVRSVVHRAGWDAIPDRIREFPTLRHALSALANFAPPAE